MRPRKGEHYLQGYFKPINPKKYKGNPTQIIYRSSWELKAMYWFDKNNDVIEWSSEENFVPYISPLDKKMHRYFYDFLVKMNTPRGIETHMIEVKPQSQIVAPTQKKKVTKAYLKAIMTYEVNQAKWDSARAYCKNKGYKFTLLNEYDLGIRSSP